MVLAECRTRTLVVWTMSFTHSLSLTWKRETSVGTLITVFTAGSPPMWPCARTFNLAWPCHRPHIPAPHGAFPLAAVGSASSQAYLRFSPSVSLIFLFHPELKIVTQIILTIPWGKQLGDLYTAFDCKLKIILKQKLIPLDRTNRDKDFSKFDKDCFTYFYIYIKTLSDVHPYLWAFNQHG